MWVKRCNEKLWVRTFSLIDGLSWLSWLISGKQAENLSVGKTKSYRTNNSLKRQLGDLDRVTAWLRAFGMVNCTPDFSKQPAVINGFSDLILAVYGDEAGTHARSAVGMASLPFNIPVEIEAEVEIDG